MKLEPPHWLGGLASLDGGGVKLEPPHKLELMRIVITGAGGQVGTFWRPAPPRQAMTCWP